MSKYNFVGQRFGKLVVKERILEEGHDYMRWRCLCVRAVIIKENYRTTLYNKYKVGAFSMNLTFGLTVEQFKDLIEKPCFYCGLPPSNVKKCKEGFLYSGVDRVNNSVGYFIENCVSCGWK